MIIPDLNLLLYAYNSDSQFHAKAAAWWQQCLSGAEPVGLPLVVVLGFLRISTNGRVFTNPLSPLVAARTIRSWLEQPVTQLLEAGDDHLEHVLQSLEQLGTAGNLVTDAQIAALAIEHNALLHTNDTDFLRFSGLRCFNPLTGTAGSKHRSA